jgi:tetratricopeptide (TPR) repeat protein
VALAELERAWEVYSASGDSGAGLSHLAAELARAHMLRGQTSSAVEWAERAIAHAAPDGETAAHAVDARVSMGTAMAQGGQPEEGLGHLRRALDEAVDQGLASIELRARTNLAWLMAGDDPRAAAETARRGLEVARQVGSREWWLQLLDIAGFIAIDTGEWDAAIRALDEVDAAELPTAYRLDFAAMRAVINSLRGAPDAVAPLDRLGEPEPDLDPHAVAWLASAQATAAMVRGDLDEAFTLAQSAAERAVGLERAEALALAGRIAIWSNRLDDAASVLAELEKEVIWGRAAELRVQTLRVAVEELRTRQPEGGADAPWDAVLTTWRSLELPYREALCLADRWMIRRNPEDRDAATRILDGLGARALVALLATFSPEASAATLPRERPLG